MTRPSQPSSTGSARDRGVGVDAVPVRRRHRIAAEHEQHAVPDGRASPWQIPRPRGSGGRTPFASESECRCGACRRAADELIDGLGRQQIRQGIERLVEQRELGLDRLLVVRAERRQIPCPTARRRRATPCAAPGHRRRCGQRPPRRPRPAAAWMSLPASSGKSVRNGSMYLSSSSGRWPSWRPRSNW